MGTLARKGLMAELLFFWTIFLIRAEISRCFATIGTHATFGLKLKLYP